MAIWRNPAFEKIRFLTWKLRKPLVALYLLLLVGICAVVWVYREKVPASLDVGGTVALRAYAYENTFDTIKEARDFQQRGEHDEVTALLERFLEKRGGAQRGQLYTNAVTDAHEILASTYLAKGSSGKALKTLTRAIERTPLNYRLWYLRGKVYDERGEFPRAAEDFRQAFKLTLDHPAVTEAYLATLAEMKRHEEILWVADHFERAGPRAAPIATVKVGLPRSELQRKVMNFVGIPVEQGEFLKSCRLRGLPRGRNVSAAVPAAMFDDLPTRPDEFLMQLRFQNVYDRLKIEAVQWVLQDGSVEEFALATDAVRYMHRDHSGVEYHAEFPTSMPTDPIQSVNVIYSCPPHDLNEEAQRIIANAKDNVSAKGQG